MAKIKIITDSASDLSEDIYEKYDIDILRLSVAINGKSYYEGTDISTDEFYQIIENSKEMPSSSQVSSVAYYEKYEELYKKGFEEAIVITLSSAGSGTYYRAMEAKNFFYDSNPELKDKFKIHVIDSGTYSVAYGYPTTEAAKMVMDGKSAKEILHYLDEFFSRIEVYFSAFTFKYIKKSGRVGCAKAIVGESLGIRPIISIIDGQIQNVAKVRGNDKVARKMAEIASQRMNDGSPFVILRGNYPEVVTSLSADMLSICGNPPTMILKAGPVITINSGPKMVGFGFLGEKRKNRPKESSCRTELED